MMSFAVWGHGSYGQEGRCEPNILRAHTTAHITWFKKITNDLSFATGGKGYRQELIFLEAADLHSAVHS